MIQGLKAWVARRFARTSAVLSSSPSRSRRRFSLEILEHRIAPSFGYAVVATGAEGGGSSQGNAAAADNAGDTFVTGYFQGTQVFGSITLTAQGNQDAFVAEYNSSGTIQWVDDLGSGGTTVVGNAIAVSGSGNVYITGSFSGTIDFPNSSEALTSSNGGSDTNAFVAELGASGQYVDAADLGAGAQTVGTGIAVDGSGNVYTTGYFSGTGVFDGGAGIYTLTSSNGGSDTNAYVSELNAGFQYVYAVDIGAGVQTEAAGIAIDGSGNVYTTGTFTGEGNFNGGSGTFNLTSSNEGSDTNAYVSKLNSSGQFVFAVDLGAGSSDVAAHGIAVDANGNIYTTGSFSGTGNFAGATGTDDLTSSTQGADTNAYLSKLNSSGQYVYALDLGAGSPDAVGYAVTVDLQGNVYTTGTFMGTGNFTGVSGTHARSPVPPAGPTPTSMS